MQWERLLAQRGLHRQAVVLHPPQTVHDFAQPIHTGLSQHDHHYTVSERLALRQPTRFRNHAPAAASGPVAESAVSSAPGLESLEAALSG